MFKALILRSRFEDHLSRKFFHLITGTGIALLFVYVFERRLAIVGMVAASILLIVLDLMRLRFARVNQFVLSIYGPLMRDEEEHSASGQSYYVVGLCWAIVFLPRPIAVQAILTLAWMDPVAGFFGIRFGKRTWNSIFKKLFVNFKDFPKSLGAKTVEGSTAGFLAATLAGILAWTGPWVATPGASGLLWPTASQILILSTVGALTAVIAEAWPSQWDDNTNIPFWTGLVVWAVATLLHVPMRFW